MKKIIVNAFFLLVALLSGISLFVLKYQVKAEERHLHQIHREILQNNREIHMLEAEWAYLNSPSRLKELVKTQTLYVYPVGGRRGNFNRVAVLEHFKQFHMLTHGCSQLQSNPMERVGYTLTLGDTLRVRNQIFQFEDEGGRVSPNRPSQVLFKPVLFRSIQKKSGLHPLHRSRSVHFPDLLCPVPGFSASLDIL